MEELNYSKLFLIGKAKDGNYIFAKIDTENFKLNYIKTKSFVVDFTQLKADVLKLKKSEIVDILFLATDGIETILDGTEQGDIIVSKIYKDFLIYDIKNVNYKKIKIYIKSYDENFEIVEYFQKDRLDRILKACEEKDNFKLENETNWNSLFDDLSDIKKGKYITKVETSENKKEERFKIFCELDMEMEAFLKFIKAL